MVDDDGVPSGRPGYERIVARTDFNKAQRPVKFAAISPHHDVLG
jgi:hypothetical protein